MKQWFNYPKFKETDRCRFCIHNTLAHLEVKNFDKQSLQVRWNKCTSSPNCNCPGFAPVDNLQYLEMRQEENS